MKRVAKRILKLTGRFALVRNLWNFCLLGVDGLRAMLRRLVLRSNKSPRVKEKLSQLPIVKLNCYDRNYLDAKNPRLIELYKKYKSYPPFLEIVSPLWHEFPIHSDLKNFRSHGAFLWTKESHLRYLITAYYLSKRDPLSLLKLFAEDDLFGCKTVSYHGVTLSRDKLDSINEIYYLINILGIRPLDKIRVLDIGAGYGRLAHRFKTLFKNSDYHCIDAIPMSTFLSEFYLKERGSDTHVVPFNEMDSLSKHKFDFAINVHSFPEQPQSSIDFWLNLLQRLEIKKLIIIDHNGQWLTMEPPDNRRSSYMPILLKHGWSMADARPKFSSLLGHVGGIYPEAVYSYFVKN